MLNIENICNKWKKASAAFVLGAMLVMPALAQAPKLADVPDGFIAIHYQRPAGDYDGWGLHVWESFEATDGEKVTGGKSGSDMPINGISWMAPMPPSGKDDFGVYWLIKANEFRNKKYNFIIHKGEAKDHCGKDMFWFPPQGNRAIIVQGDCTLYFKTEDIAKK